MQGPAHSDGLMMEIDPNPMVSSAVMPYDAHEFRREVACWKVRNCGHCGCRYRFLLKATRTGTGTTPEAAREDAIVAALETVKTRNDLSPCPRCYSYQPDMIGLLRLRWHAMFMLADLAWFVPLLLAYLGSISRWLAAGLLCFGAIAIILSHVWLQRRYPKGSHALAKKRIAADEVRIEPLTERKPEEWSRPESVRSGKFVWITVALAVGSLSLLALPDCVLRMNAWPVNRAWHPEVAGPGDSIWVFFPPNKIASVRALWGGASTATLHEVGNPNLVIPIESTTRKVDWGQSIDLGKNGRENEVATPWVMVQVPHDSRLVGKKVQIEMTLPVSTGNQQFMTRRFLVNHSEVVDLGPARSGFTFQGIWYTSALTPLALVIGMQILLLIKAEKLRKKKGHVEVETASRQIRE